MESSMLKLSVGVLVLLIVGSEAMNYLAFPRMGRSQRQVRTKEGLPFPMPRKRMPTQPRPVGHWLRMRIEVKYPVVIHVNRVDFRGGVITKPACRQEFVITTQLQKSFGSLYHDIIPALDKGNARYSPGYLAFPRMGRSGSQVTDNEGCCDIGLKREWVIGEDEKEEVVNICQTGSECCKGLREDISRKPHNGVFYSMCLPIGYNEQTVTAGKLKNLKDFLQH